MSSTNKTSIGLSQYVSTDKPKMQDMNEDNRLITEQIEKRPAANAQNKYPAAVNADAAIKADTAELASGVVEGSVLETQLAAKLNKAGDASDTTATFTEATARANISTGEKISVIFGKMMKWFTDLKAVAFSGSYNDLTEKPTSIPAAGGNADTSEKLLTARTIELSGDATGSIDFDGSENVEMPVVVADDSHNHVIDNIDGLQDTLDELATSDKKLTLVTEEVASKGWYRVLKMSPNFDINVYRQSGASGTIYIYSKRTTMSSMAVIADFTVDMGAANIIVVSNIGDGIDIARPGLITDIRITRSANNAPVDEAYIEVYYAYDKTNLLQISFDVLSLANSILFETVNFEKIVDPTTDILMKKINIEKGPIAGTVVTFEEVEKTRDPKKLTSGREMMQWSDWRRVLAIEFPKDVKVSGRNGTVYINAENVKGEYGSASLSVSFSISKNDSKLILLNSTYDGHTTGLFDKIRIAQEFINRPTNNIYIELHHIQNPISEDNNFVECYVELDDYTYAKANNFLQTDSIIESPVVVTELDLTKQIKNGTIATIEEVTELNLSKADKRLHISTNAVATIGWYKVLKIKGGAYGTTGTIYINSRYGNVTDTAIIANFVIGYTEANIVVLGSNKHSNPVLGPLITDIRITKDPAADNMGDKYIELRYSWNETELIDVYFDVVSMDHLEQSHIPQVINFEKVVEPTTDTILTQVKVDKPTKSGIVATVEEVTALDALKADKKLSTGKLAIQAIGWYRVFTLTDNIASTGAMSINGTLYLNTTYNNEGVNSLIADFSMGYRSAKIIVLTNTFLPKNVFDKIRITENPVDSPRNEKYIELHYKVASSNEVQCDFDVALYGYNSIKSNPFTKIADVTTNSIATEIDISDGSTSGTVATIEKLDALNNITVKKYSYLRNGTAKSEIIRLFNLGVYKGSFGVDATVSTDIPITGYLEFEADLSLTNTIMATLTPIASDKCYVNYLNNPVGEWIHSNWILQPTRAELDNKLDRAGGTMLGNLTSPSFSINDITKSWAFKKAMPEGKFEFEIQLCDSTETFGGAIKIELASSYSVGNASGMIEKRIDIVTVSNSIAYQKGYYFHVGDTTRNYFMISDIYIANNKYCFKIVQSSGKNTANITITTHGYGIIIAVTSITMTEPIASTETFIKPVAQYTEDIGRWKTYKDLAELGSLSTTPIVDVIKKMIDHSMLIANIYASGGIYPGNGLATIIRENAQRTLLRFNKANDSIIIDEYIATYYEGRDPIFSGWKQVSIDSTTSFFNAIATYIAVRTPTRTPSQYYQFWDSGIGWADIHAGNFIAQKVSFDVTPTGGFTIKESKCYTQNGYAHIYLNMKNSDNSNLLTDRVIIANVPHAVSGGTLCAVGTDSTSNILSVCAAYLANSKSLFVIATPEIQGIVISGVVELA